MKHFLKVRLLPICLLLILLFQAFPVTAHSSKTISLGTRYMESLIRIMKIIVMGHIFFCSLNKHSHP